MTRLPINIGTDINAGNGEAIRNAFDKVNQMMVEIYSILTSNGIDPAFLPDGGLSNSKLAQMPPGTIKANLGGSLAVASDVTVAALRAALSSPVEVKLAAYTAIVADIGKSLDLSGTWTLGLAAAASLANGWSINIRNVGTGVITVDPNASETIDGQTTLTVPPKASCRVVCDGAGFRTIGLQSMVLLDAGTVSSAVAQLDIALPSGYEDYELDLREFEPSAQSTFVLRCSIDGGVSFLSANYGFAYVFANQSSVNFFTNTSASLPTAIALTIGNIDALSGKFSHQIVNIARGSSVASGGVSVLTNARAASPASFGGSGGGSNAAVGEWTNIRLFFTLGNIAAGKWKLYGKRKP